MTTLSIRRGFDKKSAPVVFFRADVGKKIVANYQISAAFALAAENIYRTAGRTHYIIRKFDVFDNRLFAAVGCRTKQNARPFLRLRPIVGHQIIFDLDAFAAFDFEKVFDHPFFIAPRQTAYSSNCL